MYFNTGLIGYPLTHSLSPTLHSYFYNISGLNGGYCCFEINEKENIKNVINLFKQYRFSGFNITVPYKTDIMDYCNKIDKDALSVGAVNTVKLIDEELHGFNTDVYGFTKLMELSNISVKNKDILLLGAGGAAKAVMAYLKNEEPKSLTIYNRTIERAEFLAKSCSFKVYVENDLKSFNGKEFDVVINSTSIGLKGEVFSDLILKRADFAVDLQYGTTETSFLKSIKTSKVKVDGFSMLIYQAVKAFEIWTGVKVNPNISLLNDIINMKK